MTGERTEKAIARMSLALNRIATATERAESAALARARHNDRLRQAIAETLRDLDVLINSHELPDTDGAHSDDVGGTEA